MNIVYLNGQFIPQEKAFVSIMDRGFLFGDGVYESLPVYAGQFLGLSLHLARLQRSLAGIRMSPPLSDQQWKGVLHELLVLNGKQAADQSIYIQITRGPEAVRNHAIPADIKPTIMAVCFPPKQTSYETLSAGLSAITVEDRRRTDCHIKAINLLPNVLAYDQARQAKSVEAILIRNGEALEGTSSNLFIAKEGVIITPPLSPHILSGITRTFILQLAQKNHIPNQETTITEKMLFTADEIWLTGSLKEIYPIVRLNGKPVGLGKVGALWFTLYDLYKKLKITA